MKLSVALCTYNGEKYLQQQLDSILEQSLSIDEIVICDDGSVDKTIEIIEQFQARVPNKISLYKNKSTLGSTKNFENAISNCTGDYIFLSDQDDIWKVNKAEHTIKVFLDNPNLEAVFSNADLIDAHGKPISTHRLWDAVFFMEAQLEKPINLFKLMTSKRNMVTGATLCFKKEIKNDVLPFPDFKGCYHDEYIALLVAKREKIAYLTEPLISYRIHSQQQIGGKNSYSKTLAAKHLKISQYVLGQRTAKQYKDFNSLSKTYFRNYKKFSTFSKYAKDHKQLDFAQIAQTNLDLFEKYEKLLKKANPFFYFFRNLSDQIRGKRQLN